MRLRDLNHSFILEASYVGNIGAMEVFKFYKIATDEERNKLDHLLDIKDLESAWDLIQDVTKVKLHPMGK